MKTLINISIALLMLNMNSTLKAGVEPFKIYQVTEDGAFHFTYMGAQLSTKEGIKPVTVRTFFLETMRHGLLPSDMTYEEFLQLAPSEIQTLIEENQRNVLAALDANKSEALRVRKNIPAIITCGPSTLNMRSDESVKLSNDGIVELPPTDASLNLPWIVKVIVDPTDGYLLPDFNRLPSLQVNPGKQELKIPEILSVFKSN